ncbi:MAG: T9SS type A sorting domain-containing protein [Flavobacteriales bacterium]|nr:T9SS type A sorting domain-containing protein [Flavobacteriales bacterium]
MAQAPLCVDPSFQVQFPYYEIMDMDFLPSGQLLVGGRMKNPLGFSPSTLSVCRVNYNGSFDPSFAQIGPSGGGIQIWDEEYFFNAGGALGVFRKFVSDGSSDLSYGNINPEFSTSQRFAFHIFPDGKQWRTGWYIKRLFDDDGNQIGSEPGYGLVQVLPDGSTDPDFDHKLTAPGWLTSISETPDGRFLLGSPGGPTQYEGQPVGGILRVWPDGRLDTTFHSTVFWASTSPNYYHYPDGRILAFGSFQAPEYPGDTLGIMRLHPDGSTDTSWPVIPFRNWGWFFPGLARPYDFLEIEPGKLIVVGGFNAIGNQPAGAIAVVDTAGNVLWDHFTGAGAGELYVPQANSTYRTLYGIEQAPDGFIYIFGSYEGFDDGCSNHPNQRLITRLYPLDVGVEERMDDRITLQAWPNPGSERLNVTCGAPGALTVSLLDLQGRTLLLSVLRGGSASFDVSTLSMGLYTVSVIGADGTRSTTRWVKQ